MLGIINAMMESSLLSDHSDPIPVCYSQQTWKSVHERPASRSQEGTVLQIHLTNSKSESESYSVMFDSSRPHGLYGPWDSPGQNTGMGRFSLLQGVFPTQGLNPGLPHCRWILYQLSHKGSPMLVSHSCLTLYDPSLWTIVPQAPLSMEFSRQEYWSGQPFLSPGDLRNPGIEPRSFALQANSLPSEPPGKQKVTRSLCS